MPMARSGCATIRNSRAPLAAALAATLLVLPACLTIRQGDLLHARLADCARSVDKLERFGKEHDAAVAELRKVLDQATALLASNDADIVTRENQVEADISAMQARVDDLNEGLQQSRAQNATGLDRLETRVSALERSQANLLARVDPVLPEDKEQLWQQAGEWMKKAQTEEGRRFYRTFIRRFPQDPRASRATLEIGLSFTLEQQYSRAAAQFQSVLDNYPRSPEVPEAMWQLSLAFVQLHFCSDARALLADLVKRYPKSSPVREAKRELRAIRKLPRQACTS
jgi:TolA-binding protein